MRIILCLFALVFAFAGCSSGLPEAQVALARCRLSALDQLPSDPLAINGHDVSNLVARLQNCAAPADAGTP